MAQLLGKNPRCNVRPFHPPVERVVAILVSEEYNEIIALPVHADIAYFVVTILEGKIKAPESEVTSSRCRKRRPSSPCCPSAFGTLCDVENRPGRDHDEVNQETVVVCGGGGLVLEDDM